MSSPGNTASVQTDLQGELFRKSLPLQVKLHELVRALGNTEGETCLDVGLDNGIMSAHLRSRGGTWHTVVGSETSVDSVRLVLDENVHTLEDQALPFDKKTFDVVTLVDFLGHTASDVGLIEECHRVLKPEGRLVVNVAHIKNWSVIKLVRNCLGLSRQERDQKRAGYTESELFAVLKNGFDVHSMRSYSRFFVELTDAFVQIMVGASGINDPAHLKRAVRVHSVANVFFRLAFQFDWLLFFARGHYLIATANRRAWRPRDAPVLVDGRSISEAVLSKLAR